ncbi:hypothetical protein BU16DRAFT_40821 [Lophium mytilinum]|uniref:Uncharacterized protein n=1 Tax=Lophium mytilinum TaxID=390894 RepID=A0A6A6QU78_9PEZI|nr:hypothetical protein BU16DRAFT_40821 [Lophium mytilinum]
MTSTTSSIHDTTSNTGSADAEHYIPGSPPVPSTFLTPAKSCSRNPISSSTPFANNGLLRPTFPEQQSPSPAAAIKQEIEAESNPYPGIKIKIEDEGNPRKRSRDDVESDESSDEEHVLQANLDLKEKEVEAARLKARIVSKRAKKEKQRRREEHDMEQQRRREQLMRMGKEGDPIELD